MSTNRLDSLLHHRSGLATAASLGVGGCLFIQALRAGAPIGESLLGGTIVSLALFSYYAILQWEGFPRAIAVRQRLRHPAARRTLTGTVAAAGLLLLGVSCAPDADARTRCAYTGPPTNAMSVTVSGDFAMGVIKRKGQNITANEFLERPKPCSGGTPTVRNTDTISVLLSPDALSAEVRLDGGSLAPGATPETEGASEIEIQFSGVDSIASVVGTPRDDEFRWGPGGAHAGLNLNPRAAADEDVDVTLEGRDSFIVAEGAGGNDAIVADPGVLVNDFVFAQGGRGNDVLSAPQRVYGILEGGPGNDVIGGGRRGDLAFGGAGNDRVSGGRGPDLLTGGPGKDRLFGRAGRDSINSRDSRRETVKCGPGRDRVKADRRDRVPGCERIARR